MGRVQTEQVTKTHDWYDFRTHIAGGASGDQGGIILSGLTSGGSPDYRQRHGIISLDDIFHGNTPNGIGICAWLEIVSTVVLSSPSALSAKPFRFRVDGYRGRGGWLDRICFISAVTGRYLLSQHPGDSQGHPPTVGSPAGDLISSLGLSAAHFAHQMNHVTDYNWGLTFQDAAGNNGKAVAWFDVRGIPNLAVNIVSTILEGTEAGFAITGF
jgi:hypothetical protein